VSALGAICEVNLFDPDHTRRPDAALLFRKNDLNDPRLGEHVRADEASYADAHVVIRGCPQDEGVRRNGGRAGAALAPTEIRRALYKLSINGIEAVRLFDLGDTVIQPTLEATHDLHNALMRQLVADGKRVIVLGGGNDISYPDCAALSPLPVGEGWGVRENVIAFNIDAHFDVRADAPRNSGTPYRQLLEEGFIAPENFYEIGSQPFANSPIYERYLRDKGVNLISLSDLRSQGIEQTFADVLNRKSQIANQKLFWGFDLDVVRAADAPGVSAPNPVGMTGDELCQIAAIAGRDPRTRIVEFTEVNPNYDVDGRTARLAAIAIWHVLAGFAQFTDHENPQRT
jgi:formiminoglutamase